MMTLVRKTTSVLQRSSLKNTLQEKEPYTTCIHVKYPRCQSYFQFDSRYYVSMFHMIDGLPHCDNHCNYILRSCKSFTRDFFMMLIQRSWNRKISCILTTVKRRKLKRIELFLQILFYINIVTFINVNCT